MNFNSRYNEPVYETDATNWKYKQQSNQNYNYNQNYDYNQNYNRNCNQNYDYNPNYNQNSNYCYNYSCNYNCNSKCMKHCQENNHQYNNCCNQCYKHCEDFFDKFCEKFLEKCCNCNNKPIVQSSMLQASTQRKIFNGSNITFKKDIYSGTNIQIEGESLVLLAKGHIYQVSYNIEAVSDLIITPEINGVRRIQSRVQNKAVNANESASVSATFLIDTTAQEVYLDLLFESSILSTNVVGNATIVEMQ